MDAASAALAAALDHVFRAGDDRFVLGASASAPVSTSAVTSALRHGGAIVTKRTRWIASASRRCFCGLWRPVFRAVCDASPLLWYSRGRLTSLWVDRTCVGPKRSLSRKKALVHAPYPVVFKDPGGSPTASERVPDIRLTKPRNRQKTQSTKSHPKNVRRPANAVRAAKTELDASDASESPLKVPEPARTEKGKKKDPRAAGPRSARATNAEGAARSRQENSQTKLPAERTMSVLHHPEPLQRPVPQDDVPDDVLRGQRPPGVRVEGPVPVVAEDEEAARGHRLGPVPAPVESSAISGGRRCRRRGRIAAPPRGATWIF